jgi:Zn-dependent protease with chaperone function
MDFFAHQEQAQHKTTQLLALYALAVVAIMLAVYAVFSMALHQVLFWDAGLFITVAGGTLLIVMTGTLIKTSELAQGGRAVAEALGGQRVDSAGADPAARKLLNIVEEMAIASGIPVPPVYIMEEETGINAFAAGYNPGDAVVAVTRGALQQLTRDELQGVMAHEFSHIFTGDMRLNVRLIGVLHGILAIALVGYGAMRLAPYFSGGGNRSRNGKEGNAGLGIMAAMFAIGLSLTAIGYIGVFFSNVIKCAVSRQREFRADAGAVQFTRNPPGLAGALLRIAGHKPQGQLTHHGAAQASHMFFANGVRSFAASLFATHPPLQQRVQRILPDFKGSYEQLATARATRGIAAAPSAAASASFSGPHAQVRPTVGAPQPVDVANAANFLAGLPAALATAAREPFGASALLYGLLLDNDPTVRARQFAELNRTTHSALVAEVQRLSPMLAKLGAHERLPLVSLSMPALRALSAQQYKDLRTTVQALATADARLSVFEFALQRLLLRHLAAAFHRQSPAPKITNLAKLQVPLATVLQVLAAAGEPDASRAHAAFTTTLRRILPAATVVATPAALPALAELDAALDQLANATPQLKRSIVAACVDCAATDGKLALAEYELLRAITDSLDCPLPPLKTARS